MIGSPSLSVSVFTELLTLLTLGVPVTTILPCESNLAVTLLPAVDCTVSLTSAFASLPSPS